MIKFLTAAILVATANAVDFIIENQSGSEYWIGVQGNPGHPTMNNGGFVLGSKKSVTVHSPENWCGRIWARTYCDKNTHHCATGDCGSKLECKGQAGMGPQTLAEIALKQWNGLDFYDVSLVDGYSQKLIFKPLDGHGDGSKYSCTPATCTVDVNKDCPKELQLKFNGKVVGCYSPCSVFKTDIYCCAGKHNTRETCHLSDWPVKYNEFFKKRCPDAYSWQFDDATSVFACKASKYQVTFFE